jgi:uncharacterized protein YggE
MQYRIIVMHHFLLSPVRFCASVFIVLGLIATRASAQAVNPSASTIRVTGEATVTSRPDRAELDLGVVTRGPNAQQAASENARVLQNVLGALRRALGPTANIETISYALQPDYQFPQPGGEPKIVGYTVSNVVRVTQDDLSNVGTVIDAATRAGANQIRRIRFTLRDDAPAKASALRGAARDARAKAYNLAHALGLQIVRIRSVDETTPTRSPFFDLELRAAATTPILPGTIETTATVTLEAEFARYR